MDELKPCPFCGGNAKLIETDGYCQQGAHAVCCLRCGAEYEHSDKARAIAAWNTRAAPKAEPVTGGKQYQVRLDLIGDEVVGVMVGHMPFSPAAPPARDAAIPADRLSQFWRDIFPNGMSVDDVLNELTDLETIGGEVSKVYDHVTGGRISKPNTSASAVIGEADAVREREIEDALTEREEPARDAEDAAMRADAERFHKIMARLLETRMDHGTCQPRARRACTHCNAVDDIEAMIDEYAGPRMVRSDAARQERWT